MKELQQRSVDRDDVEAAIEYSTPARPIQRGKGTGEKSSTGILTEDLFYSVNRAIKGLSVTS